MIDYLCQAIDLGQASILILVDLSSALDATRHSLLFERICTYIGLFDTALNWFSPYLSEHLRSVYSGDSHFKSVFARHKVPQGSLLGPFNCNIYLSLFDLLLRRLETSFYLYADTTQIYISSSSSSTVPILVNSFKIILK